MGKVPPIGANELGRILAEVFAEYGTALFPSELADPNNTVVRQSLAVAAGRLNARTRAPLRIPEGAPDGSWRAFLGTRSALVPCRCWYVLMGLADRRWSHWQDLAEPGAILTPAATALGVAGCRKAISRLREALGQLDGDADCWIDVRDGKYRWSLLAPDITLEDRS